MRTRVLICLVVCLVGLLGGRGAYADILGVPVPYASVQAAVIAANEGDTVLVEPGVYAGPIDYLGKSITLMSSSGADVTILEGGGTSVVTFRTGEDAGAILDGFTVRGGAGTFVQINDDECYGGGIFIEDASPVIRNNIIEDNETLCCVPCDRWGFGAGIAVLGTGSPLIEDNKIRSNTTSSPGVSLAGGGGIYCGYLSDTTIRRNRITQNEAFEGAGDGGIGGGLYYYGTLGLVEDNYFYANTAAFGGAIGGGASVVETETKTVFRGNLMAENSATRSGGAMAMHGACRIEDSVLLGNVAAEDGGGIRIIGSETELVGNLLELNTAVRGGGIFVYRGSPRILRNRILGNLATDGGGIYFDGTSGELSGNLIARNQASNEGGGGFLYSPKAAILNNTWYGNDAGFRGGGAFCSNLSGGILHSGFHNNIVWGNTAAFNDSLFIVGGIGSYKLTYNDVEGGIFGEGNIDVDPLFVDADGDDVHLRLGSPVADIGFVHALQPATDADGDDRSLDGDGDGGALVDMGMDELRRDRAVLFGTVNLGTLPLADVLTVNGSIGDSSRELSVDVDGPIVFDIVKPPLGGAGKFVIHANAGSPDPSTLTVLPAGIGTAAFSMLVSSGANPIAVFNRIGKEQHVGESMYFDGSPIPDPPNAPTSFLDLPSGDSVNLPVGFEFTLQGVIVDPATTANRPVSITNGLVVTVE